MLLETADYGTKNEKQKRATFTCMNKKQKVTVFGDSVSFIVRVKIHRITTETLMYRPRYRSVNTNAEV